MNSKGVTVKMGNLLESLLRIENETLNACKTMDQIAKSISLFDGTKLNNKLKDAIFEKNGFNYSKSYSSFFDFLKFKQGDCVNFSLLYHFLLETLGVKSDIIAVPSHTIVKIKEKRREYLVETTDGSIEKSEFYITDRRIHPVSVNNGVYLSALNENQVLAIYLNRKVRGFTNNKEDYLILKGAYNYSEDIPEVCYNLGRMYNKIGNFKEAKKLFERAIGLHPNFVQAYNGLGICCIREGSFEIAKAHFKKSLSLGHSKPAKLNLDKLLKEQYLT
ncbi:MAG: tetratricopeptide repeat protein [archaeon]